MEGKESQRAFSVLGVDTIVSCSAEPLVATNHKINKYRLFTSFLVLLNFFFIFTIKPFKVSIESGRFYTINRFLFFIIEIVLLFETPVLD